MLEPIILDVECIVCNKSLHRIKHDPREVTWRMGKIINRRSRTPNWSADEKQLLIDLIKERKEVIVIKNNNGPVHSEEKDVAWNEILRGLSSRFGDKFSANSISVKKVKTQWQNMRRIAREEITLYGPVLEKYSRQSLDVCALLDLVKDGVMDCDNENLPLAFSANATAVTANVEVKTERLDEDIIHPGFSGLNLPEPAEPTPASQPLSGDRPSEPCSPSSSASEVYVEVQKTPINTPINLSFRVDNEKNQPKQKTVAAMTDAEENPDYLNIDTFHRELKNFFSHSQLERTMKIETLKEEHQVVKAMRETAELNKIIAEERLKHVLWMKKQELRPDCY